MSSKDKDFNFSLKNNPKDLDFDESSWNDEMKFKNTKKIVKDELPNYDFDESSWQIEIEK